ncbi:hypothetical protein GCM10010339_49190 [Streptomyces alanosinicus]|uniref:Uncharacterized protein n=1 Tax=Streptomyces alanosinicus TaxID=68171 RepID=A0A919D416_9ACTN|nr:hypothetical protein GCM10010339_49190 [Streptomyces alanosinicus]
MAGPMPEPQRHLRSLPRKDVTARGAHPSPPHRPQERQAHSHAAMSTDFRPATDPALIIQGWKGLTARPSIIETATWSYTAGITTRVTIAADALRLAFLALPPVRCVRVSVAGLPSLLQELPP